VLIGLISGLAPFDLPGFDAHQRGYDISLSTAGSSTMPSRKASSVGLSPEIYMRKTFIM
jgi:hypothetical protein